MVIVIDIFFFGKSGTQEPMVVPCGTLVQFTQGGFKCLQVLLEELRADG